MMEPDESWVGKWQSLDKFVPGVYAISVVGTLPSHVIEDLKIDGIQYVSRDINI